MSSFLGSLSFIGKKLLRTKSFSDVSDDLTIKSKFHKCLTTLDLVSLGVGSCIGTGMYVVAGLVAREMAGPGVIFSFLIAAIASLLSGICYAEFGVRAPKTTGSAYMYSYVTVGEFFAFIIGWNLILEYMIGTAAGASALSSCFDSLSHHALSNLMHDIGAGTQAGRGFPDVAAFGIVMAMTVLLAAGVKTSVWFSNTLNIINLAAWVFVIVCSLFYMQPEYVIKEGFLPYGTSGVFSGAATCFYAFIGFDIIATTGEESRNPSRSIPIAIIITLIICLTAYESCSLIITFMVPYYDIDPESALTTMFVYHGANTAKYFVAAGALAALTASLLGSQFPMARVIFAMSQDGLLFSYFNNINTFTNTPIFATLVSGFCAALLALLIDLHDLVEMMSIGTLLAYTLVSISVLILRYNPDPETIEKPEAIPNGHQVYGTEETIQPPSSTPYSDSEHLLDDVASEEGGILPKCLIPAYNSIADRLDPIWRILAITLRLPSETENCTAESGRKVVYLIVALSIDFFFLHTFIVFTDVNCMWSIVPVLVLSTIGIACTYIILRQPQNRRKLKFMAPCVPLLPIAAAFCNIYLMLKLSYLTWIRFATWLFIGFVVYFGYGIWSSKIESSENKPLNPSNRETTGYGAQPEPTSIVNEGYQEAGAW